MRWSGGTDADFLHAYSANRRQRLVDTIQHGIDTGELPEHLDADMAALAISGGIIYQRTMTPTPLTRSEGHRLIDAVLGHA